MSDPIDLVEIEDAKRWLDIDLTDVSQDCPLEALITAASKAIIKRLQRDPRSQPYDETLGGTGSTVLAVNYYPITAVTSVTLNPQVPSATPLPADQIIFDDSSIYSLGITVPLGKKNVRVVYTAGEPTLDEDIGTAVLMFIKALWDARLTDMRSTGENFVGVGSSTFWPAGPGSIPPQVDSLLQPHKKLMKVS